jgi:ribonucleotide reductase alpha subunit
MVDQALFAGLTQCFIIDENYYRIEEARNSNMRHRPIGLGVQGLADVFAMLELDFDSEQARFANKAIYECIYYGCLVESCDQAKLYGTYNLYKGSPISKGILQHDMWGIKDEDTFLGAKLWGDLRANIAKYGVRNSEVTALMPTASSSIRMGNTEMHEPFTRTVFVRSYTGGEFLVVNQHLVKDLTNLGLWSQDMAHEIIGKDGSIQAIDKIPKEIRF